MNSFSLKFVDSSLENKYQKDLSFAKILNFHYFIFLELFLSIVALITTIFFKGFNISRLILLLLGIFLIICIHFMAKKIKIWKNLLYIEIFIHISFIIVIMEYIILVNSTNIEYINLMLQIYGLPLHLIFISISLTRINWFWCALFDITFHIYYIFRTYSLEIIKFYPNIFFLHLICVLSFCLMTFYQEKTTRIFYQSIHESNKKIVNFQNLLKNVIPAPIFIVNFNNKKIKFVNDSAKDFLSKFSENDQIIENFSLNIDSSLINKKEEVKLLIL